MKTISERLKLVRTGLFLTQTQFGEKLGVTVTAISKLENNERNFTEQMILAVCREYSVCEEWLRTGKGEEMFVENIADEKEKDMQQLSELYNLDDVDTKWLSILLSIPPEERKPLKALALRLVEAVTELSSDTKAPPQESEKPLTIEEKVELYKQSLIAEMEAGEDATPLYNKDFTDTAYVRSVIDRQEAEDEKHGKGGNSAKSG